MMDKTAIKEIPPLIGVVLIYSIRDYPYGGGYPPHHRQLEAQRPFEGQRLWLRHKLNQSLGDQVLHYVVPNANAHAIAYTI